ncbi:MAG: T9SS type A sorting domain-containing protein [Chitinophagaceae bacterium]|nr:T9SS type A sorting domain-containing protein [Chitinophagaceae bacterium]
MKYQVPAPSATLTPSTSQNVAVGGSISFTATPSNFTGSGNHTYTWTAAGATIPPTNPISAGASNTKLLVFPTAGTYTVQVSITRGTTTLSTNTTTVNVLSAPASPNLWGISGTNVVNFTVNGGIDFGAGPTTRFAQSVGTNSAALARTDAPSQVNGYFYWLLNSQNNGGVVQVYGSDAAGGSQILIGSLDVNGAGTNSLGFVRLGARADGVVYGLAGDGTTIYLFKFKPNGVTANASLPAADRLVVEDASVTLVGGAAATFQNGDICLAGDGNMVALANDGSGLTQIFTGTPNGANTTLTKKFDVLPVGGQTFTGSVNGVAFDLQGSLYVSTTGGTGDGLYYINKNTVNGPAGTINISQVWAGSGLTDLASNFFPFTIVTPVKMASFSVKKLGNNAILDWTTVTELNSDHFDIERSYDGVNFEKVGSKQGAGNSTSDISYQFADPILVNKGIIYYRLRSVDIDMHAEYSAIVILKLNGGSLKNVSVFPNPFRSDLKVQLNSDHATVATLRISNMAGQVLVNRSVNLQKGDNVFVLTSELQNLAAGVHVLELISDDQRINQTIIKK